MDIHARKVEARTSHTADAFGKAAHTTLCLTFFDPQRSLTQRFHASSEFRAVDVEFDRIDLAAYLIADREDLVIILGWIDTQCLVEHRAVVITHIHGGVDRQQEEPDPKLVVAFQQLGIRSHQHRKGFTMAKLVIAPFLEPVEDRVKLVLRVCCQVPVDRNIARIADFL